nr:receptor-like protein kinase feronia [Quercus suber]
MTARIFYSNFTCRIPVVVGRKFVCLYFYPASYASLDASNVVFSATAGSYTLLNNFSAAQTMEALNFAFLVKEYSINVEGATLDISFVPSSKAPKAYTFVNGIKIVSMPDIYSSTYATLMIVGLYRSWADDLPYLYGAAFEVSYSADKITIQYPTGMPTYVAPVDVYCTTRSMELNPQININYNLT